MNWLKQDTYRAAEKGEDRKYGDREKACHAELKSSQLTLFWKGCCHNGLQRL
jgi:hypothetical protein